VRDLGRFCVNVLAEDQTRLSATFAGTSADRFAGVGWRPSPQGQPVLDGVVAWIDCTLWAEYEGGDHTIVVGRVLDLGADPSRLPLLFYRGGYGVDHR
jgi:flavin reductase (DIM6/NTAB) family NADH-FMN oxidoreductase RutF